LAKLEVFSVIQTFRRFIGRILDISTIIDHKLASDESLLLNPFSFDVDQGLLTASETIIIFGCWEGDLRKSADIRGLISELSLHWPVISVMNVDNHIYDDSKNTNFITFQRRNLGRDLAAFRDVIRVTESKLSKKNIVWMNSSAVWDGNRLISLITNLENSKTKKVVSMTDSWLGGYHLQSFFLFIGNEVSEGFLKVVSSNFLRNWRNKRTVVHRGERELTQKILSAGISVEAIYSTRLLFPNQYKWINSYTHGSNELYAQDPPFRKSNSS
jgi:hypothetical protein